MGLSNTQYDTIMRQYSKRQLENRRLLEQHRRTAYEKIPELAQIDQQVSSESVSCARSLLEDGANGTAALKERLQALSARRAALLKDNGLPEDYLQMHYTCPDCRDTGYQDGKKCHCLRQSAIDLFYTQSGMKEILAEENFAHFSYRYYPEDLIHPSTGVSARDMMRATVAACLRYIDEFDSHFSNLFFYGGTGLGKTFLSHCIARELIERAHSVIYYSAFELFDLFARSSFGKENTWDGAREYVFDCELLIIDDLGTELTNSFVSSQLFLILNERIQKKKSTIISTNLPLSTFAETYSERVFSRITSCFQIFQLFGNDIRLQKKLDGTA
ncbi:MAG: ATP-binding protein [Lachnospiraceae bacterium]|nr:ATP-binding protein [Lachnospiraceae bacterium]